MTEEQKIRERSMKAAATDALAKGRDGWRESLPDIWETDDRLWDYCAGVIDNPQKHNLYEQLAVLRFFALAKRHKWSQRRVHDFFWFYEKLKLSGTERRQRYRLTSVQAFQFASIYGFEDDQGRRLTRTAYIFVPRKFSKTTAAAVMAAYDFMFGDSNAEAYMAANSEEQADKCFSEARSIMFEIDPREKHYKINLESVTVKDPVREKRDAKIKRLTASPRTKDGLFASLVIMDEYSQARSVGKNNGADLKAVLTSSMGPRREPLTVVITTASDIVDGPCYREIEGAKAVLRGEMLLDEMFASLFMPDCDDAEDDPDTWAKVQPHLGVTVQADYYEKQWREAQLAIDNVLAFRTKLLNVFAVNEAQAWMGGELARKIARRFSLKDIKGRPDGMCAMDLSVSGDFSALTFGWYDSGIFYYHTEYFFPQGALDRHFNRRLYEQWAADGHLTLIPGPVIDYRRIVDRILEVNDTSIRILNIGYDAYKAADPVNMLRAAGAGNALRAVKQTYGTFTAPVEAFEHGAKTGHIFINDNPINTFCFDNAVLDIDSLENCKPVKRAANMEIDGVITMLMCHRLFMDCVR